MLLTILSWLPAAAETIRVGPQRAVKTISSAAAVAPSGSVVEVDAGVYEADVAVWTQDRLTIRAGGGRVRLVADGASAEGKAIWVMRGGQMEVEGFDFSGARVKDRNGAGIRLEAGKLVVRNCSFNHNENGILTSNDPRIELDVANSEFGHNGHGDGFSHNLYAGSIARLSVTGSYFHHAKGGHLLKSRAAVSDIRYNRLADGAGGRASYELEFANGGVAYVVGNIIEQGAQTENPHLVSYGIEGYRWPRNALYLVNNTLVDGLAQGGVLLRVAPGNATVTAVNNLLVGSGTIEATAAGDYRNNVLVDRNVFEPAAPSEYRIKAGSGLSGRVVEVAADGGVLLQQEAQYLHPRRTQALAGKPHNPGAVQNLR
ncbi:MAG: hypothetical protein LH632_03865 [Rhodoferax sp.]|nr:hypothetical protein [Rhodoferax sp.]